MLNLFVVNERKGKAEIEKPEFIAAMSSPAYWMPAGYSAAAASKMFDDMDITRSGKLGRAEFQNHVLVVAMRGIKDKFEENNDMDSKVRTSVTFFEFQGFSEKAGIPYEDMMALWALVDADNSGTISFNEFRQWMIDLTGPDAIARLAKEES